MTSFLSTLLVTSVTLLLNTSAFAQINYQPSIEAAIEQGINLRVAKEGQQAVYGQIENATNQVGRNAQETYASFRNAKKEIPKELTGQYEELIDIVWNIARLNAMDKGVYAQIAQAVQMQTLLSNQGIVKNNIFTICNSSEVSCDAYENFIVSASSGSNADKNKEFSVNKNLKPSRFESIKVTGFLLSEAKQGLNKVCYYNVAGTTYAHNISSVKICPLSMKF